MGGDGIPLAALPNIGLASMAGGRVIYPHASPEYFAEFAAHARHLGAKIIGGCCGTTPAEIAAIRGSIDEAREPRAPLVFRERELADPVAEAPAETTLARMLREGEWVVSVQLDPPLGGSNAGMLEVAQALKDTGAAQFVDINDNPPRPREDERDHERRSRSSGRSGSRRSRTRPRATRRSRGSSRSCSAPTPRASGTSSRSPATRRRRATIPAPAASTTSTRSGSCRSSSD